MDLKGVDGVVYWAALGVEALCDNLALTAEKKIDLQRSFDANQVYVQPDRAIVRSVVLVLTQLGSRFFLGNVYAVFLHVCK